MKNLTLLSLIILLLALGACQRKAPDTSVYHQYDDLMDVSKPLAFGDDRDVYLFTGVQDPAGIADIISSSITRKVQLTAPEQYFYLLPRDGIQIKDFSHYKNLIYCGTLDGSDDVSKYVRASLDELALQKVQRSGAELFSQKNVLVRDQIILILLAQDSAALEKLVSQRADQIFELLLQRYGARLAQQAYTNAVIDNKLFAALPYTIQVPQLYQIFSNDKDNNFLSFIYKPRQTDRDLPDKYVSVYYEPMLQDQISNEWLLDKRKELSQRHFPGDQFLEDRISVEKVRFAGHDALRLRGAWINKDISGGIGGAFQSFAFWEAASQTAFVVDSVVFFPAGDKLPVLLELEMISESISTK